MADYRKVSVADLSDGLSPARSKKEVDEAVGATAFGFNVYEADPGELVPWGYHRHPDHEELFYVLEGTLVVETPDRTYRLGAGEALFVPPDHRNRAVAGDDGPVRLVAVGAPKDDDRAIIEEECADCGGLTRRDAEVLDDGTVVLSCAACGAETRRF
jgi:quercetin dioxygenase-like cupin family protein